LIAAFDGAWQSIIASGAKLSAQQSELTRELLAKYIIAQARLAEQLSDPEAKRTMLRIATDYDRLAEHAELQARK
jgi:hypothetical protein